LQREYFMKVRRVGLNFQLLRKKGVEDGRIKYTLVEKVPVSCTSIDKVKDKVLRLLTEKEIFQLEGYINRYQSNKAKGTEMEPDPNVFKMLQDVSLELMDNIEYKKTEHNREAYLEACNKITRRLCDAGYAADMLDAVLSAASDSIRGTELEPEEAKMMIGAWVRVRKGLNKQGYSSKWYNIFRTKDATD